MNSRTGFFGENAAASKKLLAILMSFLLVFSFFNLSFFTDTAAAEDIEGDEVLTESAIEGDEGEQAAKDELAGDSDEKGAAEEEAGETEPGSPDAPSAPVEQKPVPSEGKAPAANGAPGADDEENANAENEAAEQPETAATIVPIRQLYISLNKTQVDVGDKFTATLTVLPADATIETIEWCFDAARAKLVSGAGAKVATFETLKAGALELNALVTVSEDKGLTDTCKAAIGVNPVVAKSVKFSGWDKEYLKVGEEVQLSGAVEPENAADKTVKWTSSDEGVLTVDGNGKVKAVGQGIASVRVETMTGAYDTLQIKVFNGEPLEVTLHTFVTTLHQKDTQTAKIPSDGTEVSIQSYVASSISTDSANLRFGGTVKNGKMSQVGSDGVVSNDNYGKWDAVDIVKVENGAVVYKTATGKWSKVDDLCAIYEKIFPGEHDSGKIEVDIRDWPYGANETTSHVNKTVQIYVYDTDVAEADSLIYDSGLMRYWNKADKWMGGYSFNAINSLYSIDKVEVKQINSDGSETELESYLGSEVPDAIDVRFNGDRVWDEHYRINAYVSAKAFDVRYDLDGGTGADGVSYDPEAIKPVDDSKVTVKPGEPTKDGYIFGGWQFDGTVYQPDDEFPMPANDVELKAWWIPAAEMITYAVNVPEGGNVTLSNERLHDDYTIVGSTVNAAPGYTFVGWFKASDMNGALPSSADKRLSSEAAYVPEGAGEYVAVLISAGANIVPESGTYNKNEYSFAVERESNPFSDVIVEKYKVNGEWVDEKPSFVDAGTHPVEVGLFAPSLTSEPIWTGASEVVIEPAKMTVQLPDITKYYGELDPEYKGAIEVDGLIGDDVAEINLTLARAEGFEGVEDVNRASVDDEAAPYENAMTAVYGDDAVSNPNYVIDRVIPGNLTILPLPLEIRVNAQSKVEGTEDPAFTGTIWDTIKNVQVADNVITVNSFYRANDDEMVGTYPDVLTADYAADPNYEVSVVPAVFSITARPVDPAPAPGGDDPAPTPGTPDPAPAADPAPAPAPAPGDATITPAAPAPVAPAPAVAAPAAEAPAPVVQVVDDPNPLANLTNIEDDETPLAAFDSPMCWVHWWIMLGMLITLAYGIGVVARRKGWTKDIDDFEDNVMGHEKETKTERVYSPAASRSHA